MPACCNPVGSGPSPKVPLSKTTAFVRNRWSGVQDAAAVARREFVALGTAAPRLVPPFGVAFPGFGCGLACDPSVPRVGPTSAG
jgi:hypothetical protein